MKTRLDALLADAPSVEAPRLEDELRDPASEEDPRWLGFWLLAMARETQRAAATPVAAVSSSLVRDLETLLEDRPAPDDSLGQLLIDPASVARRATVVAAYAVRSRGPVVALGDDDGVSLALALLGLESVHAIDIDPRVLSFLDERAASRGLSLVTHQADIFSDRVPTALAHAAAAVVTDPFRSADDAAPFVAFGLAMLRRDETSWFLNADHEEWSFDHGAIGRMLDGAGLVQVAHKRALHRYPIDATLFPRLPDTARSIGVSLEWLEAVVAETSAWSDLSVWERRVT